LGKKRRRMVSGKKGPACPSERFSAGERRWRRGKYSSHRVEGEEISERKGSVYQIASERGRKPFTLRHNREDDKTLGEKGGKAPERETRPRAIHKRGGAVPSLEKTGLKKEAQDNWRSKEEGTTNAHDRKKEERKKTWPLRLVSTDRGEGKKKETPRRAPREGKEKGERIGRHYCFPQLMREREGGGGRK